VCVDWDTLSFSQSVSKQTEKVEHLPVFPNSTLLLFNVEQSFMYLFICLSTQLSGSLKKKKYIYIYIGLSND